MVSHCNRRREWTFCGVYMNFRVLLAVLALLSATLPAFAGDDKATARLKDLQARVSKREFQEDKLRRELINFCREQVGTPIYAKGIGTLAACPSPLDRLDANAIDEEDRKLLSIRELVGYIRPHNRAIASLTFSFDGTLLATSSWDNTVHIQKLGDKEPKSWARLEASPSGIAFSPDGGWLATGGRDTRVVVWSLAGAKPTREHQLSGHKNRPFCVAFSPDGKLLASGCHTPVLRVWKWDVLTPGVWEILADEDSSARGIASLAFRHDGKLLAAANHLGKESLNLWTTNGERVTEREIPAMIARRAACSPTEPILAFAGDEAAIHLWNISDDRFEKRRTLPGHIGKAFPPFVKALAFSPDGKILASSGQDKSVRLWDVANGTKLREWTFRFEAHALAFSSDGRHLAVGNSDGTLFLLRLESAKIKAD